MFIDGCKTRKWIPETQENTRQANADTARPILGSNVHEIILFYKRLRELKACLAQMAGGHLRAYYFFGLPRDGLHPESSRNIRIHGEISGWKKNETLALTT